MIAYTRTVFLVGIAAAFAAGLLLGTPATPVQGQAQPNAGFAAVPGEKGGLDITGPYEVVPNWPKPLSTLPGHETWTWGSVQGVFAESPNRVYAIFKFTNDGKQIVQTIGTPGQKGADGSHFNRPTFMAWLPDGSFFVADGYNGNRVAKFDRDGTFLWSSGEPGQPGGRETRLGYFNTVHGIAADPMTRRVYVSDRSNRRIQVLDGDPGKPVDQWPVGTQTNLQFLIIPADRSGIWGFTDTTARIAKWDFNGRLLYSWGVLGDFPGAFFNMHGASVDQEGNLYVAEVGGGRLQKFRPRKGANPAFLVGPPVYAAWK